MKKQYLALLSVLGLLSVANADTLPSCDGDASVQTQINRAIFTSKVDDREPVDELTGIPENADEIFLFTDVRKGKDTRISHVWYAGGKRIAFANLNIGSNRWRTWSRLAGHLISGEPIHVDLIHNEQCLLLRKNLQAAGAQISPEPESTLTKEEPAPTDDNASATAAKAQIESSANRKKNKINAQDYAERVKEAALHYRDAQHAKLAGNYDLAEEHLQNAFDAIPETSPSRDDLRDELKFRVPLLRLDGHILALDAIAANSVYESILTYTENHPDKNHLQEQLREYKLKIDAME